MSTTAEAAPKRETEQAVHHDSQEEYESAEEIEGEYDEDGDDVEEIEIEEEIEEEEEEVEDEEEEDEEGLDPKQKEKPLDDDEDRKNPQFIPKKGYFYEHDDRTKVDEEKCETTWGYAYSSTEEVEEPTKKEEKPKKAADSLDKWSHDKFDEGEQAPKSREELTNLYGYDIRSEDQPPRARRRRRYGRGPTKYTRRWEEEEAYQKPRGGFRGRGGRGSSRGTGKDRRRDSKDEYEEEFPQLGDSSPKVSAADMENKAERSEIKTDIKSQSSAPPSRRDNNKEPQAQSQFDSRRRVDRNENSKDNNSAPAPRRQGGMRYGESNRDHDRERDGDSYSSRGGRGGRGGGGSNTNRRGRRNEFSNRNRYPNRRDNRDDQDTHEYANHANSNHGPTNVSGEPKPSRASYSNSYENSRDREPVGPRPTGSNRPDNSRRVEQKEYRMIVNGTSNEFKQKASTIDNRQDKSSHPHNQQQHQRVPPFTNTEYPAPAKYNANSNNRGGPPPSASNSSRTQNDSRPHSTYNEAVEERYRDVNKEATEPPQKEVRDLREKLNAMRMQKGYQNQNDRRNQMPPRLQQQQQQPPPPQQIDPQQKPRRYSTQRERPVQQPTIVTSGGMVIPNTVAPAIAQGVPNMVPVVTMAEGVVPSTVAAYQPANFYEGTQVYEASGSPVTGSGPSVSPSLWNPHAPAYATAPYPSPPTAPQVPQPPYADPTAFIGPGGPAIYAAPPQFLQDPTILNYSGAAPPFPPPYHAHPQGFQGYAQVTPAPPPEVYHAGVTYYSTQNQIQRPPMMAPQKRPKSVLQLVEPPEKSKVDKGSKDPQHNMENQPELVGINPIQENPTEAELSKQLQETTLEPRENQDTRKPTPLREFQEETSWADEMELTSPTSSYPEGNHFGVQREEGSRESVDKDHQGSTTKNAAKEDGTKNDHKEGTGKASSD